MKKVIVLGAQVPFVQGGAEFLNQSLVNEINQLEGIQAELVQVPFKWYPEEEILNNVISWRLLDLSGSDGKAIDLIIGTKFPTYAVEHSKKVLWLFHQHRIFYDLENTEFDFMRSSKDAYILRNEIRALDKKFIYECSPRFTISRNVTNRLSRFCEIDSTPLFPPPRLADRILPGPYDDRILYIGRLNELKRPDLLIKAIKYVKKAKISIIGAGPEDYSKSLQGLINDYDLFDRCEILGFLKDEELISRLSKARAVFYAPLDEDYGFITIEAFLAKKPVISCIDSGEIRTFIEETGAGFLSNSDPEEIAKNINKVYDMNDKELENISMRGYELAKNITWDNIIKRLVLDNL
ncbi:MAG: glycosyltransferase family 4 protein [Candidatus Omnitrophota bacterium]